MFPNVTQSTDAPPPATYEASSADEKLRWLWDEVQKPYVDDRTTLRTADELLQSKDLNLATRAGDAGLAGLAFTRSGDVIPSGEVGFKMLHPTGAVAVLRWLAREPNPYAGLLGPVPAGRLRNVLARVSDGRVLLDSNRAPGLALKFFLDGMASVDVLVGTSPEGIDRSQRFFDGALDNLIAFSHQSGPAQLVHDLFQRELARLRDHIPPFAPMRPDYLPVSQASARSDDGSAAPPGPMPLRMQARPSEALRRISAALSPDTDFRDQLAQLQSGDVAFEVWLAPELTAPNWQHVADLVVAQAFVATPFGDQRLFFLHPGALEPTRPGACPHHLGQRTEESR